VVVHLLGIFVRIPHDLAGREDHGDSRLRRSPHILAEPIDALGVKGLEPLYELVLEQSGTRFEVAFDVSEKEVSHGMRGIPSDRQKRDKSDEQVGEEQLPH
jgi:hypothetical protein